MKRSILVLPGGGYARHAPHEGEPVAEWLRSLGWDARVVEYPVGTRHPGPLRAVQRELAAERAAGYEQVGILGFSAGGHLAGHATLAKDAVDRPDFAILCYPVTTMLAKTHIGSRDNLLGPRPSWWAKRSVSLPRLVTPDTKPMFIWTTAGDHGVEYADHAYPLGQALAKHNVPHDFHVFEAGPHGIGFGDGLPARHWRELCAEWLAAR